MVYPDEHRPLADGLEDGLLSSFTHHLALILFFGYWIFLYKRWGGKNAHEFFDTNEQWWTGLGPHPRSHPRLRI
jgi:hypothetical protein